MRRLTAISTTLLLGALSLCVGSLRCAAAENTDFKLWFDKPATRWEEALPLGNGRLGAMVYGGVQQENIQLNENTFWAGGPHNNLNLKAKESLPTIRQLIAKGEYTAASDLAQATITSQGSQGMPYQSAGNLLINFSNHQKANNYYRELDIGSAVERTRYTIGETQYEREIFTSFADQVIVIHLRANRAGALDFTVQLTHPDNAHITANTEDGMLSLQTRSRDHEGIPGQVQLVNLVGLARNDGKLGVEDGKLHLSNASDVVILVSLATNFVNYHDLSADAMTRAQAALDNATQQFRLNRFEARQEAHSNYYRQYFERSSLDLGSSKFANEPTDKRIQLFSQRYDPSLISLYFQFGRYLLISSSQPGGQPANLQGLWNDSQTPAWDSKYTLNINAEMNYWPSEVTNLSELNLPFIDMIRDLAVTGRQSASQMYGARGWMTHHNTDIWRITGGVDWSWGAWPTSNAWLSQHLWQKYLYTGDKDFLRSAYPIMKAACEFFEDFLIKDERTGWLVVSPSMSPENTPATTGKKIAAGVTMDNQLLFDLFNNSIAAAQTLGQDKESIKRWRNILAQLPPMQIGRNHQLQEWMDDWDDPLDHHRHISHLYGLYPSNQISPLRTPGLFNAARVTLEERGDPSTGWSMNWKINFWARMLDGDRALRLINEQIKPAGEGKEEFSQRGGTYPNMFDAHPPFQIDGNFGFTAGIAEMLAQSQDGAVFLLPALPQAWPKGEVKGLVMRGGFVVSMRWNNGEITQLSIQSRLGGNLRVRSYSPLPKAEGFNVKPARGQNPNPFFATPLIKPPIKNTAKNLPELSLSSTYVIDVNTRAGETYTWSK
jgi:alpha-L-fucosidase 2